MSGSMLTGGRVLGGLDWWCLGLNQSLVLAEGKWETPPSHTTNPVSGLSQMGVVFCSGSPQNKWFPFGFPFKATQKRYPQKEPKICTFKKQPKKVPSKAAQHM